MILHLNCSKLYANETSKEMKFIEWRTSKITIEIDVA
jgi:hypothetical protein